MEHSQRHCLSIAPMLQWTDRHWRYMIRRITRHTHLYTEMIPSEAIVYSVNRGDLDDFVGFTKNHEEPLAAQLGGSKPDIVSEAAYILQSYGGYNEINLNCGCPSNKAKKAGFGAELMLEPDLVREIVSQMVRKAPSTEITVKCRLGVTRKCDWSDLVHFVRSVKSAGVNKVIIHSRVCVLNGLSCAQNRTIPPLRYDACHRLVQEFPDMEFVLNGGVESFDAALFHLGRNPSYVNQYQYSQSHVDSDVDFNNMSVSRMYGSMEDEGIQMMSQHPVHGVMIGREAYRNPFVLTTADSTFFGKVDQELTRRQVLEDYLDYCDRCQEEKVFGSNLCNLLKPMHNFFHGTSQNVLYKRKLDDLTKQLSRSPTTRVRDVVLPAMEDIISEAFLDSTKYHNALDIVD